MTGEPGAAVVVPVVVVALVPPPQPVSLAAAVQSGRPLTADHVRTPQKLNERQRELLEQLAELDGEDTGEPGLFDRVKNIFN